MKRTLIAALLFALVLTASPLRAQDETPGQQTLSTASVPANGFNCGRTSYPLYCSGIPFDDGGTVWLDSYWNSLSPLTGFLYFFNSGDDLGYAPITSAVVTKDALYRPIQLDVTFAGQTNEADGGTFTGTAKFTFRYDKCTAKYCGTLTVLTSATRTITYN